MGEAIARFREMALAIRRQCDELHSQPRKSVTARAADTLAKTCCEALLDAEQAGTPFPERYALRLCKRRDKAEQHGKPPLPGRLDLPMYIRWLPAEHTPVGESLFLKTFRDARKHAVRWGPLFPEVESRIRALNIACDTLQQYAGADDDAYVASHVQFAEALDALAPFIEEPHAPAATSENKTSRGKQKKRRDRKGIGGRPEKWSMKFIREVVAARKRDERHGVPPPIPRWLREYCDGHEIDIRKRFPPKTPGEPWGDIANRFWKAATKRLREAETNRH